MKGKIAYELYRDKLKSRARNWHELKATIEHRDKSDEHLQSMMRSVAVIYTLRG